MNTERSDFPFVKFVFYYGRQNEKSTSEKLEITYHDNKKYSKLFHYGLGNSNTIKCLTKVMWYTLIMSMT
jgi:hypothetical protein